MSNSNSQPDSKRQSPVALLGTITQALAKAVEPWLYRVEELVRRLERAARHAEGKSAHGGADGEPYVEPGPGSPRKFFTPDDLMERWKWGKTKVYQIPETELPFWKRGHLKRYYWAHVWAYENRISREEADRLYAEYDKKTGDHYGV